MIRPTLVSFPFPRDRGGVSDRGPPRQRVGRTTEGERRDFIDLLGSGPLYSSGSRRARGSLARSPAATDVAQLPDALDYSPDRVTGGQTLATHEGIFPTFFLSGFECSTFDWRDQGRRNLVEETRHAEHADEDYALLRSLGIAVAREGIPWPLVEREGRYDFSSLEPFITAMNRHQILPIWDLCHYSYPDDADPFESGFAGRFAEYARAAAEYVV